MPSEADSEKTSAGCDLCGLRLPHQAFREILDNREFHFCCGGCRQVFLILHDSGLLDGNFKESELYQTSLKLGIIGNPDEQSDGTETFPEELLEGTQEMAIYVDGMWCSACAWLIEKVVNSEEGVVHSRISYATDTARIHYRPEVTSAKAITSAIQKLGYKSSPLAEASEFESAERMQLLLKMGIALFLMMNVMYLSYVLYVGYFEDLAVEMRQLVPLLLLALAVPSVFWCGLPIHRKAYRSLAARAPTMEVLFSLSIFAAFFYSIYGVLIGDDHVYFDTAVSLVALFLVGKFIEVSAKHRATRDVTRLYRVLPKKVRLLTDEGGRLVSAEHLQVGDRFSVRSGEKIPADGRVMAGSALIDESLLTGESKPTQKKPGDEVTGSTMNLNGLLEVEALRVGDDTVLAGIIQLVETALTKGSRLEHLVDRIARFFIPSVLLVASLSGIWVWNSGAGFEAALVRCITVLVIACPCALGLATPLAVAASIGFAARRGILIRDGDAVQVARKVDTLVFDKTGTLTQGKFKYLAGFLPGDEEKMLSCAGALEQNSSHPVAEAIVEECRSRGFHLEKAEDVTTVVGMGIEGWIRPSGSTERIRIVIGNERFLLSMGYSISETLAAASEVEAALGLTVVFLGVGEETGFVALGDSLKPDAVEVVAGIRSRGISVRVLSGDGAKTTESIAREAGIDHFSAGILPDGKIEEIQRLQATGAVLAMVGDGINDAPALAQADLGLAMGSGTDIALESAAVIILHNDLKSVSWVLDQSRRTFHVIVQNLGWAFFYNAVGLALAVSGYLNPLVAAVAMLASSISVVGNSIRLSQDPGRSREALLQILMPWRE